MSVKDVMTREIVTVRPSHTIAEVAGMMARHKTGSLVVTEDRDIVGIITERDVVGVVAQGNDPRDVSVGEVMSKDVVTVDPETPLRDAARLMVERWFRHLPVVTGGGSLVGVLSIRDVAGLVAEGMHEPQILERLTGHKLVRQIRLERITAGDLD